MTIQNKAILAHVFLGNMQEDEYFPAAQVEKGKEILIRLCEAIEAQKPDSLDKLYALTHAATEEFNLLGEEFEDNGSQLETGARENIGADSSSLPGHMDSMLIMRNSSPPESGEPDGSPVARSERSTRLRIHVRNSELIFQRGYFDLLSFFRLQGHPRAERILGS